MEAGLEVSCGGGSFASSTWGGGCRGRVSCDELDAVMWEVWGWEACEGFGVGAVTD
jgi:hypothetical protein